MFIQHDRFEGIKINCEFRHFIGVSLFISKNLKKRKHFHEKNNEINYSSLHNFLSVDYSKNNPLSIPKIPLITRLVLQPIASAMIIQPNIPIIPPNE